MDTMPNDLEVKKQHGGNDHLIVITVDGVEHKVRRGDWVVSALKAALGVDPAKVLAEITHHGLKDLDDSQSIKVLNNEKYMTHARSGGSS
jgi:hypothetical protein